MTYTFPTKPLFALIIGAVVGAVAATLLLGLRADDGHFHSHDEAKGAYHVHADFLMMVNDTKVDLSADKYMSVAAKILHPGVHLHDHNDTVIHFHARDITLVEFLSSLDITLTKDCLMIDDTANCSNPKKVLQLYVNDKDYTDKLKTYVPYDEDHVLLYYGVPNNPKLPDYLKQITNDACLYSGTCPERGTAPPENCGLTCELE